jgi:Tfp pilus assembly protein PilF
MADSVLGDEQYADHLLSIGKFDAARDWYEHAQALAPRDPGAMLGLGTVAAAQGFDDSLNGHPELAGTQQTRASQYFQDAIHLDADYGPAYIALARLLTWKKDNVGAVDALTNAVRIDPNNLRARLDLGGAQRRAGDLKGAEDTLTTLLIDAPNVAAVHSELGDVYIQEHKRQEALAEWQRASQLDPNNTTVLLNFGALLDSSGEPELAAKQFQAATIVDPSLAVAHFDLAHVYTKLGHRQDAVDELTKAVALEPNNPHVTDAYARAVEDENKKGPGTPATSQPATAADGDAISAPASQPAGGGDLGKP